MRRALRRRHHALDGLVRPEHLQVARARVAFHQASGSGAHYQGRRAEHCREDMQGARWHELRMCTLRSGGERPLVRPHERAVSRARRR
ncbi:hypothetical protein PsYK624_136530 [Phanerochaete sordida]|uniref:Uncharacterized protein n=1 Tax=Phanerochaete sordida TaxID=48140 RepID=A0A9P3LK79_9APHY|nr:hypothetical protein PsYK624_136530 [Phanerochaete sordida]